MKHARTVGFRFALVGLVALAVSACGSGVQFVPQDMTKYPPRPSDAMIEVYDGGVMRPHAVIGTLTAAKEMKASFGGDSTYDQVIGDLKKHARKVGADALIHVHPVSSEDARVVISATAIRFFEQKRSVTSN